MPAKRVHDPEARKAAIIRATESLILTEGYHGVSHRKIAKLAGVSLGTTTAYFSSLDDLRTQALEHMSAKLRVEIDQMVSDMAEGDPAGVLARLLRESLDDPRHASSEMAFALASIEESTLRPVASGWFEATEEAMLNYTSPAGARAVAIYCDGVMMQVTRKGARPTITEIRTAILALMQL